MPEISPEALREVTQALAKIPSRGQRIPTPSQLAAHSLLAGQRIRPVAQR